MVVRRGGVAARERIPRPVVGSRELLLRMRVCGLCGTDLFKLRHGELAEGSVLGHEVVGTVAEVGAEVSDFRPGDRVVTPHHLPCGDCHLCRRGSETLCESFRQDLLAPGGFSEHVLVRHPAVEHAARRVPDDLTDEAAVFLEPAACVLRGLERAGLTISLPPETAPRAVLVTGAGSMGLLHLLLLRVAAPDADVLLTDPVAERRAAATRLGARAALPPDDLGRAVAEITGGRGVDLVVDTVGRPAVLRQAVAASREGATIVLFAHGRPTDEIGLPLNELFKSERRLIGTYSGGPREQRWAWQLLESGELDPSILVTHRLPLSRFAEGVELATDRRALKVLFVPDQEGSGEAS